MTAAAGKKPFAASRRQLLLVGVLGLIFVVVLFIQFGPDELGTGQESADEPAPAARRARQPGQDVAQAPGAERNGGAGAPPLPTRSAGPARPWPVVSFHDAVRYDPFATPAEFIARAAAAEEQQQSRAQLAAQHAQQQAQADADTQRQKALETLRAVGVSAILSDGREPVALIGSQMVRVGDVLQGFRVVAIGPEGVTLGELEGGFAPADQSSSEQRSDSSASGDSATGADSAARADLATGGDSATRGDSPTRADSAAGVEQAKNVMPVQGLRAASDLDAQTAAIAEPSPSAEQIAPAQPQQRPREEQPPDQTDKESTLPPFSHTPEVADQVPPDA